MPLIQREIPWTRQPQIAEPKVDSAWALYFTNVWNLKDGAAPSRDLKGAVHLTSLADAANFTTGVTVAGVGLRGNYTGGNPNGLGSSENLSNVQQSTFFAMSVVVFDSFPGNCETQIFRCNGDFSAAIGWFPSTKTIRPLLGTNGVTAWTTANDATDTSITAGVPWFIAFDYANGQGLRLWSGPVGSPPTLLKQANTSGLVNQLGILRVGGSINNSPAFPGVILALGIGAGSRPISGENIAALARQPWQLFAPRTQRFATSSAGTTPTLGTPTFVPGSLSASGFRPRFPVTWG